jgi:hypothetical protein
MMLAALTLLRLGDTERKLILYDTFEGLPKPNQQEDIDIWGHSALQNLYPVLSNYGVLIVDDYGHLRGQRKAVDEYFAARKEVTLLHRIDYSARVMMKYQS